MQLAPGVLGPSRLRGRTERLESPEDCSSLWPEAAFFSALSCVMKLRERAGHAGCVPPCPQALDAPSRGWRADGVNQVGISWALVL